MPMPSIDVDELSKKEILRKAAPLVHSNVIEINAQNHETFIKENPAVPKVLFFHDKKNTPLVLKGLSVALENKQFFGIVRKDETSLQNKYKVNGLPKLVVVVPNEPKPKIYDGDLKFKPVFQFLNIYTQTFVPGGGSASDSAATKPWLTEVVPEMHIKSADDICFKVNSALCVILAIRGNEPEKDHVAALKELNKIYERKLDRGLVYKFMWINLDQETNFAETFNFENVPAVAILNPGKRKKILVHDGEISVEGIRNTFEKIIGGDARFKRLAKLPELSAIRKDL